MKSALRNDLERLRRDAISARHQRAFEVGRGMQPVLAEHADAASVLAMLDDEAEGTYPAREVLMKALLHEHRTSHAAVWSMLLMGAFKPMLVRLRGRLVERHMPAVGRLIAELRVHDLPATEREYIRGDRRSGDRSFRPRLLRDSVKINAAIDTMHEDLQYDYRKELAAVT